MDKKLNVAMFSDSFYPIIGGRENVIDNLMRELSPICNTFLATTTFKGHKESIKDSDFPYEILRCKSLRITKNEYLSIINRKFKKQIEEKIKNGYVDIIHVHTKYALLNYAFKLRKKYNIPVVTTVHTNYQEQYKKQLKLPFIYKPLLKRVKKVINKTDAVYTVSETMRNILKEWGIIREIKVIPNGNDLLYPENIEELRNKTYQKYNLNQTDNILLYVGRIVETKNLTFMFHVLKDLKQQNLSFKIILAGGGEIIKYKKLAESLDIINNCIFTGAIHNRNEIRNLYLISDLLVSPSKIETFGLTIQEAGSMGTPSIVVKNCATSEGIINNVNGFISKPTIKDFSSTILSALKDKTKLKSIGANAKNTFTRTWKAVAIEQLNEYKLKK